MTNKLIYWVPIVGIFVSLAHYERDNEMVPFWHYYQAVMIMAFISIIAFRAV
jgi:hypothetical protein